MTLKKIIFLAFFLTAIQAQAKSHDKQISLTMDLTAKTALAPGGASPGLGGFFFADWRVQPFLSLGTGFDFTNYFNYNAGGWQTATWVFEGRIFPFPSNGGGEFYLQGGLGLNLITYSLSNSWPGLYNGTAGLGYLTYVDENSALDLGAQYDFYNHLSNPLHAIGIRAGWTVFL